MEIQEAVAQHIDKTGGIYTDDIIKATSSTRESVTRWLKSNGFHKPAGATSRRWVTNHTLVYKPVRV
jgi:hypothetical protein